MLHRPTLFVIGAGAGKDVGMPLGDELSNDIADKLNVRIDDATGRQKGPASVIETLRRLAHDKDERFDDWCAAARSVSKGIPYSNSIDDFLATHGADEMMGTCAKIAIALAIVEKERACPLYRDAGTYNWTDRDAVLKSWMRAFLAILAEGVSATQPSDVFKNLFIVNFNYDRCVEHFLFHAIQYRFRIDADAAKEVMKSLKIFHPYGTIPLEFGAGSRDLLYLSSSIRTLNEESEGTQELEAAREAVANAHNLVFLGFHFHKQNVRLLRGGGVNPGSEGRIVRVYGTVKDRSSADVEKIRAQVGKLYRGIASPNFHLENIDCRRLFTDFGMTLSD